MDVLINVIAEQWVFILLAAVLIGLLYFVKAKRPDDFQKIAFIELVATVVVLVVFALFGFQDLFLLAPIILICCELFGYTISGKVVGILLVDFILIQLLYLLENKGVISNGFSQVAFYVLQIAAAVVVGLTLDNHIRTINKEKKNKIEAAKQQEKLRNKKMEEHVDDIVSRYAGDEKADDKDYDVDDIEALLDKYSDFDDPSNEIFSSSDAAADNSKSK